MIILKTYSWNRRDFYFDAVCDDCSNVMKNISGYDDANFYDNVIPSIKCDKCGKSSKDLGRQSEMIIPRYDPNTTM